MTLLFFDTFTFAWPWMAVLIFVPFLLRKRIISFFMPDMQLKQSYVNDGYSIFFPHLLTSGVIDRGNIGTPYNNSLYKKIMLCVWILLVVSLMRPQMIMDVVEGKSKGYDIMIAVDVSASMKALDFSSAERMYNRFDITKRVVSDFIHKRTGDRIGLILFGEHAYLPVPLTLDIDSVNSILDTAFAGVAGDATAIGDAIGLAVQHLKTRPESSRILILVTDGDDTASSFPPLKTAEFAREYGIRIYTISVGKNGIVPFPDRNGDIRMVEVSVNSDLLKEIAAITEGEFFIADTENDLQMIYHRIDSLEKSEVDGRLHIVSKSLHRYPLGIAMCILLLSSFSCILGKFTRVGRN